MTVSRRSITFLCIALVVIFIQNSTLSRGQTTSSKSLSITSIQLLPPVVEEGKDYTIGIRLSNSTGLKPDAFFFIRPLTNGPGNSRENSRFQPEIQGTDYKKGVIVLFRYHAVIPGGNSERYEGLYKIRVEAWDEDKRDVKLSIPDDENKFYKVVVKGRPLNMVPLTSHALIGRWANSSFDFEFFEDGTMVVYRYQAFFSGTTSGQYHLST